MSGRSRDDVEPRLRSAFASPYVVFYRISTDGVEIVRILHGRRNLVVILGEGDQPDGT
jgi:toxin ParE1/3/4